MARFIFETPALLRTLVTKLAVNDRSSQPDCISSKEQERGVEKEEGGRETYYTEDECLAIEWCIASLGKV
jgi:hypothetical protein